VVAATRRNRHHGGVTLAAGTGRILTPDQRPRVFVSSTLQELAVERAAARDAIEALRLIPVMFELGARPHPARALYRAYLAQSHVFVGVYHERYGWVAPGEERSGLEDEYRLSGVMPRLVYLKVPAPGREPRLGELLDAVRADDTVSYKSFGTADELQRLLRDDLAVLLAERFLGGDTAPQAAAVPEPVRVPRPPGELFGREADVAEIEARLAAGQRLVTIVGTGGIGKTRVALEAAHRAAQRDPDGVACVPLESVTDPAAVLPAIAARIGVGLDGGVPVLDVLAAAFGDRPFLLMLDNVEQLLPAAVDLAALLEVCPQVSMLVTSRAALRVRGEQLLRLGPLALPVAETRPGDTRGGATTPAGDTPTGPEDAAAVRLFVDRAQAVRAGFTLDDPEERAAVAELCRRLDGIPLALEIAAARSSVLPPRALLERIATALDLGAGAADLPARQRTLRDTLAWSEQLLSDGQRDLLARLSVFSCPWTLADAEAVAGPRTADALDDVAGLVENSLVQPMPGVPGEPRFLMFETVRAFAADRLSPADRAAAEEAFVRRMAGQVDRLSLRIRSPTHARWRAEAQLLWPDVRRAWELALAADADDRVAALIEMVGPLWLDGRSTAATPLVLATLDRLDDIEARDPVAYGEILLAAATRSFYVGEYDRTAMLLDRLDVATAPPSRPGAVGAVDVLRGYLAAGAGDLEECGRALSRAVDVLRTSDEVGDRWILGFAYNGLGSLHLLAGDPDAADREFEISRDLGRESGNIGAEMQALVFIASHRVLQRRDEDARGLLAAAADLMELQPFYEGNAYGLEVAASFALAREHPDGAAEAIGVADELRSIGGVQVWALLESLRTPGRAPARAALGEEAYRAAVAAGRARDPRTAADVVRALLGSGRS
jgi:predicted ATPase